MSSITAGANETRVAVAEPCAYNGNIKIGGSRLGGWEGQAQQEIKRGFRGKTLFGTRMREYPEPPKQKKEEAKKNVSLVFVFSCKPPQKSVLRLHFVGPGTQALHIPAFLENAKELLGHATLGHAGDYYLDAQEGAVCALRVHCTHAPLRAPTSGRQNNNKHER